MKKRKTAAKGRKGATRVPARMTPAVVRELVEAARDVRHMAYAPYSGFHVGAALLGASGRVYLGFNVENVSYSLCICAERTAVVRALLDGEREFVGIAVATDSTQPVRPCGSCRQFLREFCEDMPVVLAPLGGRLVRDSLNKLLPDAFFTIPSKKGKKKR